MFEQKIAFSQFVFCSHAAISHWFLLFFRFFVSNFFLIGFSNPFKVHSRPSFVLYQIDNYSYWFFVLGSGILKLIFCFFSRICFTNSLIVRSRSSFFCLGNENSLNCTSGVVLLCFLLRRTFFSRYPFYRFFNI